MVGDYLVLEKGIKTDKITKELNCIGLYFKELYLCLINIIL